MAIRVEPSRSEGRLAEIFGLSVVNADRAARITGYTAAELDAQFAILTSEEQEIFDAYVGGINRYLVRWAGSDLEVCLSNFTRSASFRSRGPVIG